MNLLEIKQYMMEVKMASLSNICHHFGGVEAECLRHMLDHWVRKGCLRQLMKTARCGVQCAKCPAAATEIYEWVA